MTKTILITGASSGFGLDIALTLAACGHKVFAGLRDIEGRNASIADTLRQKNIQPIELDVTQDHKVDLAVKLLLQQSKGKLDIVINNAGIASAGVSESFTPEQLRDLFEVNVFGVQRLLRAVLPTMRQQGDGLVITIGSILGRVTFPFFGLYGASKFALEAMMDSYRYELSQFGVDVVLVQPSAYPTNMYTSIQQAKDVERAKQYGAVGDIPSKMFETFMAMFQGENAPNPHDVALAIETLIAIPKLDRPQRRVVGTAFGADHINDLTAPVQRQVIDGLGLGALAALKI